MNSDRAVSVTATLLIAFAVGVVTMLLFSGCARQIPYSQAKRDCQDDAVRIVWNETYGRTDRPPDIWWVPPAAWDCKGASSGKPGFSSPVYVKDHFENGCVAGRSWVGGMDIMWAPPYTWYTTAFQHEAWHIVMTRNGEEPDWTHTSPGFQAGGAVEKATAALKAAHLCEPAPGPSAYAWH